MNDRKDLVNFTAKMIEFDRGQSSVSKKLRTKA